MTGCLSKPAEKAHDELLTLWSNRQAMDRRREQCVHRLLAQYTGDAEWKVRARMSHCCRLRQINSSPFLCNVWLTNGWSVAVAGWRRPTASQLFQRLSVALLALNASLAGCGFNQWRARCRTSSYPSPLNESRQWTRPHGGSWKKSDVGGCDCLLLLLLRFCRGELSRSPTDQCAAAVFIT